MRYGACLQPFNGQCPSHIETSKLICSENQLTGFYVRGKLTVKGLITVANSVSTKNFQTKILSCKIIIDALEQGVHTLSKLLSNEFLTDKSLMKSITKRTVNFRKL